MNNIVDMNIYLSRMQNGLEDKLWWVGKTEAKKIVDFGCADGTLLKHLHAINPEYELIGVDIDENMCQLAKENVPTARIMTTREFMDSVEDWGEAMLVLSSVIHEIYSYEPEPEHEIQALYKKGFKYIAIRDMFMSERDINRNASYHDTTYVVNYSDEKQLHDFEKLWGHVGTVGNMCHFLLKYRYIENWDRECCENYFPISLEQFLNNIPEQYAAIHIEHYCHAYTKTRVRNDFFINFNERTHANLLLTRKPKCDLF